MALPVLMSQLVWLENSVLELDSAVTWSGMSSQRELFWIEMEEAQLGHAADLRGDFPVELVVVDAQAGHFGEQAELGGDGAGDCIVVEPKGTGHGCEFP